MSAPAPRFTWYDEGDLVQHRYYGTLAVVEECTDTHVSVTLEPGHHASWPFANVTLAQHAPETTGDP